MKYFRKEFPKTKIFLPNGSMIQFEPRDANVGYYQTDKPIEIAALEKLEREHRGGVFSIPEGEHQEAKKKAGLSQSKPAWREEIGQGVAQDTMLKRHVPPAEPGAAAAAAVVKPPVPTAPTTAAAASKPPVKPPNVGRRP